MAFKLLFEKIKIVNCPYCYAVLGGMGQLRPDLFAEAQGCSAESVQG